MRINRWVMIAVLTLAVSEVPHVLSNPSTWIHYVPMIVSGASDAYDVSIIMTPTGPYGCRVTDRRTGVSLIGVGHQLIEIGGH